MLQKVTILTRTCCHYYNGSVAMNMLVTFWSTLWLTQNQNNLGTTDTELVCKPLCFPLSALGRGPANVQQKVGPSWYKLLGGKHWFDRSLKTKRPVFVGLVPRCLVCLCVTVYNTAAPVWEGHSLEVQSRGKLTVAVSEVQGGGAAQEIQQPRPLTEEIKHTCGSMSKAYCENKTVYRCSNHLQFSSPMVRNVTQRQRIKTKQVTCGRLAAIGGYFYIIPVKKSEKYFQMSLFWVISLFWGYSKPNVLVSSTAVTSFSYNIEKEG